MMKREVAKRLLAAGIVGDLTGKGEAWEVELADDATMELFCEKVVREGGYRTGYGAWVLRPGYKVSELNSNHYAHPMHY